MKSGVLSHPSKAKDESICHHNQREDEEKKRKEDKTSIPETQ
jgi:hypothetical protein